MKYEIKWFFRKDSPAEDINKFRSSVKDLEFSSREEARAAIRAIFLLVNYLPVVDDAMVVEKGEWNYPPEGDHYYVFGPTQAQ